MKTTTLLAPILCAFLSAPAATAASVQQVSAAAPGVRPSATANGPSAGLQGGGDGRFLVFVSGASDLTTDVYTPGLNVFWRDRSAGKTLLVSAALGGGRSGNGASQAATLSPNGQWVAFESRATDLISADTSGASQVYVRDMVAGQTALISVGAAGTDGGHGDSGSPLLSADGRYVAFESVAADLVANDTNGLRDVFVRDRVGGATECVSVDLSGFVGNVGHSRLVDLSTDGRYVLFTSRSANPVGGTPGLVGAVFLRDRQAGTTICVSRHATNFLARVSDAQAAAPAMSADGRYVAYRIDSATGAVCAYHDVIDGVTRALATNLVANSWPALSADGRWVAAAIADDVDGQAINQVYVWDTVSGQRALASVNATGAGPGNASSDHPTLSADGRWLAFISGATDLTTNAIRGVAQVYVRDLQNGGTRQVSTRADGTACAAGDFGPTWFSPDGRSIALETTDEGLVADDRNRVQDVFLRDLTTGTIELISIREPAVVPAGPNGDSLVTAGGISQDGRFVAFASWAENLTAHGVNRVEDVFRRDLFQGTTVLASANLDGTAGDGPSYAPSLSGDGRWLTFASEASGWGASDTNRSADVWLRDVEGGGLTLVSRTAAEGGAGNAASGSPALSADGRTLVFQSRASDLIAAGGVASPQWYERDLVLGRTFWLKSVGAGATWVGISTSLNLAVFQASLLYLVDLSNQSLRTLPAAGQRPFLCPDGRKLVALLPASGTPLSARVVDLATGTNKSVSLISGATSVSTDQPGARLAYAAPGTQGSNGRSQVYLCDVGTGSNVLVSVNGAGEAGNGDSRCPSLSRDGRYVVFHSQADNLVKNDTNGRSDVFVRDLVAGTTRCLSVNPSGVDTGNGLSAHAVLGPDGRTVVFESFASDLAAEAAGQARNLFATRLPDADSRGVGMDDAWQLQYFGDLTHDGSGDADGDGLSDGAEYLAGTDPTDPSSLLRILSVERSAAGQLTLSWSAVPGRDYRIEYRDDLSAGVWHELPGDVRASSSVATHTDPAGEAAPQRFYRVVVLH